VALDGPGTHGAIAYLHNFLVFFGCSDSHRSICCMYRTVHNTVHDFVT